MMKNSTTYRHSLVTIVFLLCVGLVYAQNSYKETFTVGDDAVVSVNTSHTNVVFETWNKDKVEVEAFIEGDDLTDTERQEIFDSWKFDVLGNSKKVVITSNEGSLWGGFETLGSLHSLDNLDKLTNMSHLKNLESLSSLGDLFENMNIVVPELPEMDKMPVWPFSNERPSFRYGDSYSNYNFQNNGAYTFDRNEYEDDKSGYVKKLNKKYNSNVSVAETDRWLDKVDAWSQSFEKRMESWGENFGKTFEKNFGPKFEKRMEKWGEEFGEQFGKEMEKWGENFGKDMEKWGAQIEKQAEQWAKQFEDGNFSKETIIDEHGNKSTVIQRGAHNHNLLLQKPHKKAKKTIIIRMPKDTKTDINVRHGEIKMADVTNVRATLNYAALTANSIDGGKTLINAAYAPVRVNYWGNGVLAVQYVEDCKLNEVDRINLKANSSNVNINEIKTDAYIKGSIGNLFINKIAPNFASIDIVLEDTDAKIELPSASFNLFFSGKKSTLQYPKSLQVTQSKEYGQVLVKGFNKSNNPNRKLTINANFSNVRLQ